VKRTTIHERPGSSKAMEHFAKKKEEILRKSVDK
jgi:hypothetical protein